MAVDLERGAVQALLLPNVPASSLTLMQTGALVQELSQRGESMHHGEVLERERGLELMGGLSLPSLPLI